MDRPHQLRFLRDLLNDRRRRVLETRRSAENERSALNGQERDPEYEENAQVSLADDTLFRLAENEREELAAIDGALARMDEGSFGRCLECGGAIPFERLKALPYTQLCAEDAQAREAAQRVPGTSPPTL